MSGLKVDGPIRYAQKAEEYSTRQPFLQTHSLPGRSVPRIPRITFVRRELMMETLTRLLLPATYFEPVQFAASFTLDQTGRMVWVPDEDTVWRKAAVASESSDGASYTVLSADGKHEIEVNGRAEVVSDCEEKDLARSYTSDPVPQLSCVGRTGDCEVSQMLPHVQQRKSIAAA